MVARRDGSVTGGGDSHATVPRVVNEHRPAPFDVELRADALDVLQDLRQWRMTAPRWATVRRALEAMRAAYDVGDGQALRSAVYDLELAGPVRANSIGGEAVAGPPEPVYDIANVMVHDLSGEPPPSPEDPS